MVEHYDNNENKNDILKKLYIWTNIENNIINIEYNNKTIVNPGKYGLNIVIINTKMEIKNVLYIDTGTQFYENDIFIDLVQNKIDLLDLVIIVTRGDAFKQMSAESKIYLQELGGTISYTGKANYILIGSKGKKTYYEKISWSDNVYFPQIIIDNIGCFKIVSNNIKKIIDITPNLNINKYGIIALQNNTNKFAILNNKLYLLNDEYNYNGSGYDCPSNTSHNVYIVNNVFINNLEIKKNNNTYVTAYIDNDINYSLQLYSGIYDDIYLKNMGAYNYTTITGLKIPSNFIVYLLDHLNYKRAIMYCIKGPLELDNLNDYKFGGLIKKVIVVNTSYKIIFSSSIDYNINTKYLALPYGSFKCSENMQIIIKSIQFNIQNVKLSLFDDDNFKNVCYSTIYNNKDGIINIDNEKIIKSIIIEYV
jgi:hypothetical protein